jgi:hypothetical protein
MNAKIAKLMIVAMLATLLLMGCGKVTKKNYDKISMGMSYAEVISILGDADECSGAVGVENCTWGKDDKYIKINFVGKKVVLFSAKGL